MAVDLAADHDVFFHDFAESGSVTPVGGSAREVDIVVNREEPSAMADNGVRVSRRSILIRNSATDGMTPAEAVQQTSDQAHPTITFKWNRDDAATVTLPIGRILRQNAGCLLLEVMA